jgi:hypothetical protein
LQEVPRINIAVDTSHWLHYAHSQNFSVLHWSNLF